MILKLLFFGLNIIVKSGIDLFIYFELEWAPSELLLNGQANPAFLSIFFATLKGLVQFQNKKVQYILWSMIWNISIHLCNQNHKRVPRICLILEIIAHCRMMSSCPVTTAAPKSYIPSAINLKWILHLYASWQIGS